MLAGKIGTVGAGTAGRVNGITTPKIWGTTTALLRTPMFELHRLWIKPGHRCSMHRHQCKHNAFFVIDGTLYIDTELGIEKQTHDLRSGETYTIAPGVKHQFRTGHDSCLALEMYFTEPLSEDIIRDNVGGPVEA